MEREMLPLSFLFLIIFLLSLLLLYSIRGVRLNYVLLSR